MELRGAIIGYIGWVSEMVDMRTIIHEIEEMVCEKHTTWTIGITDNPAQRWLEHNKPKDWYVWQANSESEARAIEKVYLDKGMEGDVGGGKNPTYLYIFKEEQG